VCIEAIRISVATIQSLASFRHVGHTLHCWEHKLLQHLQNKRRTIKFPDVDGAVRSDQRLVEMGLKDMLSTEDMFAHARAEQGDGKENGPGLKASNIKAGKGAQPITAFFNTFPHVL
jgi:hypothetical protein